MILFTLMKTVQKCEMRGKNSNCLFKHFFGAN